MKEKWRIKNVRVATMKDPANATHTEAGWTVCIEADRFTYAGPDAAAPPITDDERVEDGMGRLVTPGLIDAHTHLVWAGSRAGEFAARLEGASYAEISRAGGGIASTVRATRAASEDDLYASASRRLDALALDGVTTVEIKSGYGLDTETELKMLRVARRLGERPDMHTTTTFLGAHAMPPGEADKDAYIARVCSEMLPAAAAEGLVDAVDGFCESIGFSRQQMRRVFERARELGLPVKLHAEQLTNQRGAELAAEFGALSADHLEYLDEAGAAAMSESRTVAMLLPGAFYTLKETKVPPIDALRSAGVRMAVATDANPGTSPLLSLRLMMHMACTFFGLTVNEALAGTTINAALALGVDGGFIAPRSRADLAIWHVERAEELVGTVVPTDLSARVVAGRMFTTPALLR